MAVRDRDPAGKARNARPRDAAGRPLPRGAEGVERVPDDLVLPPREALAAAQRMLEEGRPFPAHDVLEAVWKAASTEERPMWRALAQLAVGLTHLQRGNTRGAVALLERAADGLERWMGARAPYGADLDGLATYARTVATAVEQGATSAAPPRLLGAGEGR